MEKFPTHIISDPKIFNIKKKIFWLKKFSNVDLKISLRKNFLSQLNQV